MIEAMASKYPYQIFAAPRKNGALTVAASLSAPKADDNKKAPLEMYSAFSVFNIAIAQKENGSVVANIPPRDVPSILMDYEYLRRALTARSAAAPKGAAYSVNIPDRNCGNKPAAEVLMMPNGQELLKNARSYLAANADRYPRNRIVINAIDEALELQRTGKLQRTQVSELPPLYKSDFKHKSQKNEKGQNLIYFIEISVVPGMESPWKFTLKNCFAFLPKDGGVTPDMKTATPLKQMTFSITQQEMDFCIYMIRRTMENFELINFKRQMDIADHFSKQNMQNRNERAS